MKGITNFKTKFSAVSFHLSRSTFLSPVPSCFVGILMLRQLSPSLGEQFQDEARNTYTQHTASQPNVVFGKNKPENLDLYK